MVPATESSPAISYRCLIVEDETLVGLGLQSQLESLGHRVIGNAADAEQAERFFRNDQPDLVLTDIRLGDGDGLDLAKRLLTIRACPIVIISAFSDKELIDRATAAGVFGYLIKPVSAASLAAQIEISVVRFREHLVLRAENLTLSQNLENRKLIERAKGILMTRFKLSEPDAHRRLQQESQRRRISAGELARKIVESEDLLDGLF